MKILFIAASFLLSTSVFSAELSGSQLQKLSDCDYFKYTKCTAEKLNIGACVKKKYKAFAKACGNVHADKYTYSREMFVPKNLPPKDENDCDSLQESLCVGKGLSLAGCVSKYKKKLEGACGKEFVKTAAGSSEMDKCFRARKRFCGKSVDADCEEKFLANAPKECTSSPKIDSAPTSVGGVSEKKMMEDCSKNFKSECKIDEKELMKDGTNTQEYLNKYKVCLERSLKRSTGKCGSHLPKQEEVKGI